MVKAHSITRTKTFWLLFTILSLIGIIFSCKYFYTAVPIVTLDIAMDRNDALEKARQLSKSFSWGPTDFMQAASFQTDEKTKIFVDLEGGGKKSFIQMMKENLYMPYTWQVRHFKEHEKNETIILFTPDGKPYGFKQILSENLPGKKLQKPQALLIAQSFAKTWGLDLSLYKLAESSKIERASGRIDHTFVYERKHKKIGRGTFRLNIKVSGDIVSELVHFVKIPDEFPKKYQAMRSANDGIARVASLILILLYIIGGCIIGTSLLMKQKYVTWRVPIIAGFIVSLLLFFEKINNISLLWFGYKTAESSRSFIFGYLIQSIIGFLSFFFLYALTFAAAESLTRKAFGKQIKLWSIFSRKNRSSIQVLGRTVGAYLLTGISIGLIIATYLFSTRFLGWWLPYEEIVNPNILATSFPWISAIAKPLAAGFWEECMFRAVPIAGAALIGSRLGKRNIWIAGALILQAVIFGAAHANYPTQPAYARLLELIIPSLIYGLTYIKFGLLPVIITHVLYDIIFFGMPIFISSSPSAFINQGIIIILVMLPLLLLLLARLRSGKWTEISKDSLNNAWQPPEKIEEKKHTIITQKTHTFTPTAFWFILSLGIFGTVSWLYFTPFTHNATSLTITQKEAFVIAKQAIKKRGITIPAGWVALPVLIDKFDKKLKEKLRHRFVWQSDKNLYKKLLGNYLYNPLWVVRFVTFKGSIAQRTETYQVFIDKDGRVMKIAHIIPEKRKGASLDEQQAKRVAQTFISQHLKLDPNKLKAIAAQSKKLPHRKKWLFTFSNKAVYPLDMGQARIKIQVDGNEITNFTKYIHTPETWQRKELQKQSMINILTIICLLLLFSFALAALMLASSKVIIFSTRAAIYSFFGISSLLLILNINSIAKILATFNTIEPFSGQLFQRISSIFITTLFISSLTSILIGMLVHWISQHGTQKNMKIFFLGTSAGMILVGTYAFLNFFQIPLKPLWPNYSKLASNAPTLGIIGVNILYLIIFSFITLLFAAALEQIIITLQNKKILLWTTLSTIFVIGGMATLGIHHLDSISFWVISGTLMGILCLLVYWYIIRFEIAIIPLIIAAFISTRALQQALFSAFTGATFGFIIASIITMLLALFLYKTLNHKEV